MNYSSRSMLSINIESSMTGYFIENKITKDLPRSFLKLMIVGVSF